MPLMSKSRRAIGAHWSHATRDSSVRGSLRELGARPYPDQTSRVVGSRICTPKMADFIFPRSEIFGDGPQWAIIDVSVVSETGETPPPSRTPTPSPAPEQPPQTRLGEREDSKGPGEGGMEVEKEEEEKTETEGGTYLG